MSSSEYESEDLLAKDSPPAVPSASAAAKPTGGSTALRRKISTSKSLTAQVFQREGYLLKQGRSFQRWRRRYFRLKGRKLYYAQDHLALIFNEIDLIDFSVAERHSKSAHAFQVITPFAVLVLAAETRREMEEWVSALKSVSSKEQSFDHQSAQEHYHSATSGDHAWYVCSHGRPTHCNACRENLSGVAWHGLSCEVCKIKSHKRCATKISESCKWTTVDSIPRDLLNDDAESSSMPHQWLEGNLPMGSRCGGCEKACGSVLKLQDWRCLWCNVTVHDQCRESINKVCQLGPARLSVLPPVALKCLSPEGTAELRWSALGTELGGGSPLLVLVNSKSGDNHGLRVLRKFKRLLNPAQVFDIMSGGPDFALNFFKKFDSFRVLVCGGDGTVGWVLSALDRLELHSKCQLGVLPLGTGNDLARVLGWGHAFEDDTQLPHLLETFEQSHSKMLDRWSVMTYEGQTAYQRRPSIILQYEQSVADHLSQILSSDDHSVIIMSAKILCETVKDFLSKIGDAYREVENWERSAGKISEESISEKCEVLQQKLDNLLKTLQQESQRAEAVEESGIEPEESSSDSVPEMASGLERKQQFAKREALMSRANSLKKAIRQIIEHTERAVDEQNKQTGTRHGNAKTAAKRHKWRTRRSKTTPAVFGQPRQGTSPNRSSLENSVSPPPSPMGNHLVSLQIPRSSSPDQSQTSGLGISPDPTASHERSPTVSERAESVVHSQSRLIPPSIGSVQPPTPCMTPSTSDPARSFADEIGGTMSAGSQEETSTTAVGDTDSDVVVMPGSTVKPASESDIPGAAASTASHKHQLGPVTNYDIKLSHSDSSIYAGDQSETSPTASRKVSKGSTLRLFNDRVNSPQKGFLPSFKRGLLHSGLTGGSLIAEVLLLNADVLGVAASPLMDFEEATLDKYQEKKVMNNYFGIGLDAKVALEFHKKREEYPDKARSRSKLHMWYAMFGGKELLQRTYKNLEQRVHLECDGQRIQLPSLQGIVILNIQSYSGGANFWGSTKEDSMFTPQSFDDKVLEVVALFGVIHVATSRVSVPKVVRLQNHRIAQCRHVKIIITGDDPIPVQVDGEPWLQPPGYIQIVHKNRAQVLVRNPAFEATLKTWQEQKERTAPNTPTALGGRTVFSASRDYDIADFLDVAAKFIETVQKESPDISLSLDVALIGAVAEANDAVKVLDKCMPPDLDDDTKEAVATVRTLVGLVKSQLLIEGNDDSVDGSRVAATASASPADLSRARVADALDNLLPELQRIERRLEDEQHNAKEQSDKRPPSSEPEQPSTGGGKSESTHRNKSRFAQWLRNKWKGRRARTTSWCDEVNTWTIEDVGAWLSSIGLSQYRDDFAAHEVTGKELLKLERSDLKDLGVTKVGHLKRVQSAINDLVQGASDPKPVSVVVNKPSRSVERVATDENHASVSSL